MSGIKVQLNSLDALKRLLGVGDDGEIPEELLLEIRRSALDTVTAHLMKVIGFNGLLTQAQEKVESEATKMVDAVADKVLEEFTELTKPQGLSNKRSRIVKASLREDIERICRTSIREEIQTFVGSMVETAKIEEELTAALKRATDSIVTSLTDANLERRLDRMVDAKLKEKLGLK